MAYASAVALGMIYPLADRIYNGRLEQRLSEWRAAGESHDAIAYLLRGDGVKVSGETVRGWCRKLGIDGEAA